MSKSARSVYLFSFYLFGLGAVLILMPNLLLGMFGMPETNEIWIRVAGVLVLDLGVLYYQAGKNELKIFYQASVYGRLIVFAFFIGFVILGLVKPVLILFGSVDALAAFWTHMSLKSE
jgi:hypothetical protein